MGSVVKSMTPSLRDAAKAVVESEKWHHVLHRKDNSCPCIFAYKALEAALAEPEPPKVERVEIPIDSNTWYGFDRVYHPISDSKGIWRFYAERPIPAKSRAKELVERLDELLGAAFLGDLGRQTIREASETIKKLLRERKP